MTREEHLKFCKTCNNRKADLNKGLVCRLTDEIANFESECKDFSLDERAAIYEEEQKQKGELNVHEAVQSLNVKAIEELRHHQDLYYSIIGGLVTALFMAIAWAGITVTLEMQIGYMAIAVGIVVGISVRFFGAGIDKVYGIVGASLAFVGCLAGNLLSLIGFIAESEKLGYMETLSLIDLSMLFPIYFENFNPIDLLFYGIAISTGYKFSFRSITPELLTNVKQPGFDATPENSKLRMPLIIGCIILMAGFFIKLKVGYNGEKTYYHPNGKILSKGKIKNNKLDGKWLYYGEDGSLQLECYYNKGEEDSLWTWYSEKGQVLKTGIYRNGLETGVWQTYYENGNLLDSGAYFQSRKTGAWVSYYENGQLMSKGLFDRDLQNGKWEFFYENGGLTEKGKFDKGTRTDIWESNYNNGSPCATMKYKNDSSYIINNWDKNGKQTVKNGEGFLADYDNDFNVIAKGSVKNGFRDGKWYMYNKNGKIREEGHYIKGAYYVDNLFSNDNELIVKNGSGTYYSYYDESNIYEKGKIDNGLREGEWEMYYNTGSILKRCTYFNGKQFGKQMYYDQDGMIYSEGEVNNDLQTGIWTWYHPSGGISSSVNFVNGKKDGKQSFYNISGEISKVEEYENGALINEKVL